MVRYQPTTTDDIGRIVQSHIDGRVSPYDAAFAETIDRYSDRYADEYLDEVATHLGRTIVQAFEEHDRKQYIDTAQYFGDVYAFLFPVSTSDAETAGAGYATALEWHDVIEDGLDNVKDRTPIVDAYDGVKREDVPTPGEQIQTDDGWEHVRSGFQITADSLGLPDTYTHRGEEVGSYPFHQTEFFRHHTVANEASAGTDSALVQAAQEDMVHHARNAQIIKYASLVDTPDTLDWIADEYIDAIAAHDAHTQEKQWENVERMTRVYRAVLAEVIDREYFEDG